MSSSTSSCVSGMVLTSGSCQRLIGGPLGHATLSSGASRLSELVFAHSPTPVFSNCPAAILGHWFVPAGLAGVFAPSTTSVFDQLPTLEIGHFELDELVFVEWPQSAQDEAAEEKDVRVIAKLGDLPSRYAGRFHCPISESILTELPPHWDAILISNPVSYTNGCTHSQITLSHICTHGLDLILLWSFISLHEWTQPLRASVQLVKICFGVVGACIWLI